MKQFESFGLDTRNECLWQNGTQLSLPPKPFAVLRYLVENPGRLITHDELLDALWPETYVQPQVLRTYMLDLRKVLGDDAGHPRFIQTLPKRGYCFVAAVTDWAGLDRGVGQEPTHAVAEHPVFVANQPHLSKRSEAATAAIVGRDPELGQLKALTSQIAGGQRQVAFVTGEVGIGKTALVDAFADWAADSSSATVVRGQCVEGFGGKEEYYPVIEVLRQLCASPDGDRACRTLAAMAPAWLGVHGKESGTDSARSTTQERMPGDVCAALEELASTRPLILLFEDLHWADDSTLHLISALARRRAQAQLMIVVTLRPQSGVDGANGGAERQLKGLRQDLLMRRLCTEIALLPLKKTAVKELLIRELQQEALPPGLAGFVHQHSEGNPLFAIAILEHLIAQHFLMRASGSASDENQGWEQRAPFQEMEAGVPDGLSKMIELEMERLTPEEQCMLEAGSLMHVAFPAWAVAAALKRDAAEIEEACDNLARRLYFVERAGQDELPDGAHSTFYVFAHGLYREVLYHRQSATRRAQRHIRIAEKLGELFQGREAHVAREMAMHFEAAGNLGRAVDALRRAAELAQKRQAFAEAADLLERALRVAENLSGSEHGSTVQAITEELRREPKIGELAVSHSVGAR